MVWCVRVCVLVVGVVLMSGCGPVSALQGGSSSASSSASASAVVAQLQALAQVSASVFHMPSSLHSRHPRADILEFLLRDEQITILASSNSPQRAAKLYYAPADITVADLLASRMMHSVMRRTALLADGPVPLCSLLVDSMPAQATPTVREVLVASPDGVSMQCRCHTEVSGPPLRAVWHFRSFESLFPTTVANNAEQEAKVARITEQLPSLLATAQKQTQPEPAAAEEAYLREERSLLSTAASASAVGELATPALAALYPFESKDYGSELKWALEAVEANKFFAKPRQYPTWRGSGVSGRFDAITGQPLKLGQLPAAQPANKPLHISLAADWAAGTIESDYVGQLMSKEFGQPDWTLNAGDVYWTGTRNNIAQTMLGVPARAGGRGVTWPKGRLGSFHTLGNHELYSAGGPTFDYLLPTLGTRTIRQAAAFATLETKHWRILLLDTGFGAHKAWGADQPPGMTDMQPELYRWLEEDLRLSDPSDKRGVLIITHHQPHSYFESAFQLPAKGLADRLPPGRQVVWLFGHEHRTWMAAPSTVQGTLPGRSFTYHGRCIGNSGFPTNLSPNAGPATPASAGHMLGYDSRVYQTLSKVVDPLRHLGDMGLKKSFNGWVELRFSGPKLSISYRSLRLVGQFATNAASDEFASEVFNVDPASGNAEPAASVKFNYRAQPVQSFSVLPPKISAFSNWLTNVKTNANTIVANAKNRVYNILAPL